MDEQTALEWFEQFRVAYPKRDGANPRKPAWDKWFKLMKVGTDPSEIISGAKMYCDEIVRKGQNNTIYVAQAVTWLNQRRWEDYTEAAKLRKDQPPLARHFVEAETEAWTKVAARWRAKNPLGPPIREFRIGPEQRITRGWWFTTEYAGAL